MFSFEFDGKKSDSNREKHGIDFIEAQLLWLDTDLVVVPANTEDEPRYIAIGKIADRHWSAIYTLRGKNIRLISVRRSRTEEEQIYES